jgi:hypothetical protein
LSPARPRRYAARATIATFLSFIYTLGHFLTDHTMAVANLSTVGFFAGTVFCILCALFFFIQLF